MFQLNSDITIGNFRFSGVNEVHIVRSIHSFCDVAKIKLPSIARIVKDGKLQPGNVVTGKQFKEGDAVSVRLGYNNNMQTEFKGFVTKTNLNMPLEVECEGYSWLLRRNTINVFWPKVTVKELLEAAVSNLDQAFAIEIRCEIDLQLCNYHAVNENGFDIIRNLLRRTDGCICCYFIEPNVLWCGLAYSAYGAGKNKMVNNKVEYRLGYNVMKDNSLKERFKTAAPVSVRYSKRLANGETIAAVSSVFRMVVSKRSRILNQITDREGLEHLANEKALQMNYSGYEGSINTFLEPFVLPGYDAYVCDSRYPERNGVYLVESVEVNFGIKGARRTVELGPISGFLNT